MAEKQSPGTTNFGRILPWLLIIGGTIGLFASTTLLVDKIKHLENPNFIAGCSLNPVISCGSIMSSGQSHALGVPNPILGLVPFAVLVTVGVAILAGAKFKRWFWLGLQAGTVFGLGFVHWLFFQSVYRINALCLYCISVWIVTIAIFWYVTLYNLNVGNLKLPKKYSNFELFLSRHHAEILIVWYAVITVLILNHFWYYFKTII